MNAWVFKFLKWLWGEWGPADLLLISSYVGTGMEWSLPLRRMIVVKIVGLHLKKWKQQIY